MNGRTIRRPNSMQSKRKREDAAAETADAGLNLPFSLYLSFADVAGICIKPCGIDGQLLPGAADFPTVGPCSVMRKDGAFVRVCADHHAGAVAMALELRRPHIANCHMRLAAWAVPILHDGEPLPAAIICGGILLRAPDAALVSHVERVAAREGIDPARLVRSLDSVPVLSRDQVRAIADFLFRMSAAFASLAPPEDTPEVAEPHEPHDPSIPESLIISPTARRKESKRARLRRARMLERQNVEAEVVRLLRGRRSSAALETLAGLLRGEDGADPREGIAASLAAAETFTRLFRMLAGGERIPRSIYNKQSILVAETLSRKTSAAALGSVERSCRKFISIAEEMTGRPRPRQVKAIQRYLEKNLSRKLTLGTVGKKFGLKEKALDALMRKHCGMGFTDHVVSLRISEAKRLLRSADLSIGEIARRTGFKDQSYFTKVFKSNIGSTPTEFREKKAEQAGP